MLDVKLTEDVAPLPADTTAEVRLASVLGGKYVELVPGHSRRTIPEDGRLPLANAAASVEIEDALSVFDPEGRSVAAPGDRRPRRGARRPRRAT